MKTRKIKSVPPRWPRRRALVLLSAICLVGRLLCSATLADDATRPIDWNTIAELQPDLKLLVLVESEQPLSLANLASLGDRGFAVADRDSGLIVGLKSAVFKIPVGTWAAGKSLPNGLSASPITRFHMSGIYRVAFKVVQRDYDGPLALEVTEPRGERGKKLVSSEHVVRPATEARTKEDSAGNRWLVADFPRVKTGETIKIHMGFSYLVDVAEVLAHGLMLTDSDQDGEIPPEIHPYLGAGYKIDPNLPQARAWASQRGTGKPVQRKDFKRLAKMLQDTVTYNTRKKTEYFGGLSVYKALDHMYQTPVETLRTRTGCCPDTVLLECSYLRARGIPCRTAGRFGHFYSEVYVAGRGWMSTSVTPTGIPLIIAPSPDHVPYQRWEPSIALRTSRLEARIRIEPLEKQPCK